MARLSFIPPPTGLLGRSYQFYRDWLEINFYSHLCSYCLLQHKDSLQIEHHEPQKYAEGMINDPSNLLLGCPWCNSGKSDYHPNHSARQRLPKENRGFSVIDIREEDFAEMFSINDDGEITAKLGSQRDRIKFNIVNLLRLNGKSNKEMRTRCFNYIEACGKLLDIDDPGKATEKALQVLVRECAERYLFYLAYDIPISDPLRKLIETYIAENKPRIVS